MQVGSIGVMGAAAELGSSFSWVREHVEMTSTAVCTPIPLILTISVCVPASMANCES